MPLSGSDPEQVLQLEEVLPVGQAPVLIRPDTGVNAVAFARDISTLTLLVGLWAFVGAPVVTAGASFAPFLRRGDLPLERINEAFDLMHSGESIRSVVTF